MQWTDEGIIIAAKKYGENKLLMHILTKNHGLHSGMVSRNQRNMHVNQIGNFVNLSWNGRLKEHIGSFALDLKKTIFAKIIHNSQKISALSASAAIIYSMSPEREDAINIYLAYQKFLEILVEKSDEWQIDYFFLELAILSEAGFSVDFRRCAVSGVEDDLFYVSPRTAKVVSREVGEKFHDKLLILPDFLKKEFRAQEISKEDVLKSLKISGYFLQKFIYDELNAPLPKERSNIIPSLINNRANN